MEIAIFESVVIESALHELEEEGKKYAGLYVDMDNAPERKYVKDKAALINTLKKKVERVRIDAAKAYKIEVEKQAAAIHERLDAANEPFQSLIDVHTLERKAILDAEKARKQAILDTEQLLSDHEQALMMNQVWDLEANKRKSEKEKAKAEQEAAIKLREEQAVVREVARLKEIEEAKERDRINEENARLANKEHKSQVNNAALDDLVNECHLTPELAKHVVIAIAKGCIRRVSVNY